MRKILDDSRAKSTGKAFKNTKIFLYSAHESNIAHLLRFLDIFQPHIPPYGSYIAIEIHNIEGTRTLKVSVYENLGVVRSIRMNIYFCLPHIIFILQIYYQDYSTSKMRKYRIPKCATSCTLEKFEQLYKHLLPLSEMECLKEK